MDFWTLAPDLFFRMMLWFGFLSRTNEKRARPTDVCHRLRDALAWLPLEAALPRRDVHVEPGESA